MDLESKCEAAGDESLGQVPLFLTKLFDILSADSWRPIIRWSEDGRSFVVADVINFERQVLPLYWGHSSLPSFIQSLGMYHFEGKSLHPAHGLEFSHESFARVRRRLHSCPDPRAARDLLALLHARYTALIRQHPQSRASRHNMHSTVLAGTAGAPAPPTPWATEMQAPGAERGADCRRRAIARGVDRASRPRGESPCYSRECPTLLPPTLTSAHLSARPYPHA